MKRNANYLELNSKNVTGKSMSNPFSALRFMLLTLIGSIAFSMLAVQPLHAIQDKKIARLAVGKKASVEEEDEEDDEEAKGGEKYPNGGTVKTDPDLNSRLDKAEQFKKDGNFRIASRLWQSVLAESSDILYSDDKETYYSLTQKVEETLAQLPANGLSAYRIAADANAREMLAMSKGIHDIDTLANVVKNYFISSEGDDAAYKLGCIMLDRYDFVGAVRFFRKITDQYPDPSVEMDQVWIRIALCYAYIGDRGGAEQAIAKAIENGMDEDSTLLVAVKEVLQQTPEVESGSVASEWTARFGGSRRLGIMPSLPEGYDQQNLKADWQYYFKPLDTYKGKDYLGETFTSFVPEFELLSAEENLIKAWRERYWRPAGSLLFTEDEVVFRTGADITVWDRKSLAPEKPNWRPLWLNRFTIDETATQWKQLYEQQGITAGSNSKRKKVLPSKVKEVQLYGDQIAQSMSIHRGILLSIEGNEYSWNTNPKSIRSQGAQNRGYNVNVPRRTRTNRLAAYDLQTGKLQWRLPTPELLKTAQDDHKEKSRLAALNDEPVEKFEDIGFMDAPVGFGDLLLVPVNVSGSIWVYALDGKKNGALVWKSFLCDEPSGGSKPWSPIRLSIEGSTAYATCGTGVVFALDPMTGGIRFARRYSRTGNETKFQNRFRGTADSIMELDGWDEDVAIPLGNLLIMTASDFNVVWAIDRQTGKFLWKTENRPFGNKFEYLIGVQDGFIYLGGPGAIAAISVKAQGRWEWVYDLGDDSSYGRAMMTPDGIYVPVENRIVKLALQDPSGQGKVLSDIDVRFGLNAPVGNLYSDGEKIWVLGANRLYSLGPDDGSIQPDTKAKAEGAAKEETASAENEEDEAVIIAD